MGTTAAILFLFFILVALLYPLWRPPLWVFGAALGPAAKMAALQERKLALYGAIREVGFDLRTDKMSESDYQTEVEKLKAEAVGVMAQIEALGSSPPRGPDPLERMISNAGRRIKASESQAAPTVPSQSEASAIAAPVDPSTPGTKLFCTQCGRQAPAQDRFCAVCGAKLHRT